MKYAVVAVGYNRPDSIKRLIKSVCTAVYPEVTIDLIVSVDRSTNYLEVLDAAKSFEWKHGEFITRTFEKRQGLRQHILLCGDYTNTYDAVIVLEDDLVVSPYYFEYVDQTVKKYANDQNIGGISLYKHSFHPGAFRMFEADANGYDVFFMQYAQSWGQCWTKSMWDGFRTWYSRNESQDLGRDGLLPSYISRWNEHSWLKYYMRYLVETNKYFVYPYVSLSTNASDAGQHCLVPNNDYQVPMRRGSLTYRLPDFVDAIKYDVFFERSHVEEKVLPDLEGTKILDFYGLKKTFDNADYLISTQKLPYYVVEEIGLVYKPIEQNAFEPELGHGAFVYKLSEPGGEPKVSQNILTRYDVRAIRWKALLKLSLSELLEGVKNKIRK